MGVGQAISMSGMSAIGRSDSELQSTAGDDSPHGHRTQADCRRWEGKRRDVPGCAVLCCIVLCYQRGKRSPGSLLDAGQRMIRFIDSGPQCAFRSLQCDPRRPLRSASTRSPVAATLLDKTAWLVTAGPCSAESEGFTGRGSSFDAWERVLSCNIGRVAGQSKQGSTTTALGLPAVSLLLADLASFRLMDVGPVQPPTRNSPHPQLGARQSIRTHLHDRSLV